MGACGPRVSGDIANGCMAGGRSSANSALCSCIQQVANQALSPADQRRAAEFFDNPDVAQQTRTRDDAGTEAFWARYRAFADTARAACG